MNVNFNNIGIGTGAFGGSQSVKDQKVESQRTEVANQDLRLSPPTTLDVLQGSEPVSDVPSKELVRNDGLGKLVAFAYNLPPPPMPNFNV